jgi:hypothetical protein
VLPSDARDGTESSFTQPNTNPTPSIGSAARHQETNHRRASPHHLRLSPRSRIYMVASVATAAAHAAAARRPGEGGRREPATMHAGIRRSRSEPHLRCSRRGGSAGAALTTSRSIGVFPFQFGAAPLRPPLLPDGGGDGSRLLTVADDPPEEPEMPAARRHEAHWLDRLLELRSRFHDPANRDVLEDDDGGCGVTYDDYEEEAEDASWDQESFGKLLARAPPGEARLFAQLAFLCNMAYVIPEIKVNKAVEIVPSWLLLKFFSFRATSGCPNHRVCWAGRWIGARVHLALNLISRRGGFLCPVQVVVELTISWYGHGILMLARFFWFGRTFLNGEL